MRNKKALWVCKKDCELCEGDGVVYAGMEGFINRQMEQDSRDIFEPCVNAHLHEPDYDEDEANERSRLRREQ